MLRRLTTKDKRQRAKDERPATALLLPYDICLLSGKAGRYPESKGIEEGVLNEFVAKMKDKIPMATPPSNADKGQ